MEPCDVCECIRAVCAAGGIVALVMMIVGTLGMIRDRNRKRD